MSFRLIITQSSNYTNHSMSVMWDEVVKVCAWLCMKGDKGSLTWTLVFGIFAIWKKSVCQDVSVSESISDDQSTEMDY